MSIDSSPWSSQLRHLSSFVDTIQTEVNAFAIGAAGFDTLTTFVGLVDGFTSDVSALASVLASAGESAEVYEAESILSGLVARAFESLGSMSSTVAAMTAGGGS